MNPENKKSGFGRFAAGVLLGLLLAVIGPLAMLTQVLSLMPVLMLPAAGLIFLYRWAGRGCASLSAALLMIVSGMYLGGVSMWIMLFTAVLPLAVLIASEKAPFFEQMKRLIAAFAFGVVASVAALYFSIGGDMIRSVLMQLPEAARTLPTEGVQTLAASYGAFSGMEMNAEDFIKTFEDLISALIPVYQMNLPGQIFSGALISAVACAVLNAWMLSRQGRSGNDVYRPLHEWALPASVTCGLLLITIVSFIMGEAGINNGETVFTTALKITLTAFRIQALASMARRLLASSMKQTARTLLLVLAALLGLFGGSTYIALYGCASAILGSRGVLKQRYDSRNTGKKE